MLVLSLPVPALAERATVSDLFALATIRKARRRTKALTAYTLPALLDVLDHILGKLSQ